MRHSDLAALLQTLGFTISARHKNKEVTLYRQGGINIVVNTEKEGLAHSSYLMHGTSAYAIGLKVDDAAATVARAKRSARIFSSSIAAQGSLPFRQSAAWVEARSISLTIGANSRAFGRSSLIQSPSIDPQARALFRSTMSRRR